MKKESISFQEKLYSMTTLIYTELTIQGKANVNRATGFFFVESEPVKGNKEGWYHLGNWWLITNRHVIYNEINEKEFLIDKFVFHLRKKNSGKIDWLPIVINKETLMESVKLLEDKEIDVVAINITSFIMDFIKNKDQTIIYPCNLTTENFPRKTIEKFEVADEVLIVSYPLGFYDNHNNFPIVKSGIISSGWGLNFRNQKLFEVDIQLYPGSSGGLVISKPKNILFQDGTLYQSEKKQFVFLGIYSGEYTIKKTNTNDGKTETIEYKLGLGNVWYSEIVDEIIKKGKILNDIENNV